MSVSSRSRIPELLVFLVPVAMVGMLGIRLYQVTRTEPLPREEVDAATLEVIDFSEVPPPVAGLIAAARENETIGRPVSDFPELWTESLPGDPGEQGRYRCYEFILPMTRELREENDRLIEAGSGPLSWPMLLVRVDTEESRIVRVAVYTQGF